MKTTAKFPNLKQGFLKVGDGHQLYWRSHGNASGPTVVILHGGPGAGLNPKVAVFFDPAIWQVVLFDQRGCGQSTPFASTEHNTLADLVTDMERLRVHLGVKQWAIFGGSWGTRLALSYGVAHPDRCVGFILRGIFLGRERDVNWFLWGAQQIFPREHAALCREIADASGSAPQTCRQLLELAAGVFSAGQPRSEALAQAWTNYEKAMSSVSPMPADSTKPKDIEASRRKALSLATLECHYMRTQLPHAPAILDQIAAVAHLPCWIVHGRYDIVCPVEQADALVAAWPGATLRIAPMSGHWTFEPEMAALLDRASSELLANQPVPTKSCAPTFQPESTP